MADQLHAGFDPTAVSLGKGYKGYTVPELVVYLNHYGYHVTANICKNELMNRLNTAQIEFGLTIDDRLQMQRAYRAGESLPPTKPRICRASVDDLEEPGDDNEYILDNENGG